jgi:hypothetical protein
MSKVISQRIVGAGGIGIDIRIEIPENLLKASEKEIPTIEQSLEPQSELKSLDKGEPIIKDGKMVKFRHNVLFTNVLDAVKKLEQDFMVFDSRVLSKELRRKALEIVRPYYSNCKPITQRVLAGAYLSYLAGDTTPHYIRKNSFVSKLECSNVEDFFSQVPDGQKETEKLQQIVKERKNVRDKVVFRNKGLFNGIVITKSECDNILQAVSEVGTYCEATVKEIRHHLKFTDNIDYSEIKVRACLMGMVIMGILARKREGREYCYYKSSTSGFVYHPKALNK